MFLLSEVLLYLLPMDVTLVQSRKVDIRLPRKGDSNSHGARPVHQKHRWIRTSRLSIKNSLSLGPVTQSITHGLLSPVDSRATPGTNEGLAHHQYRDTSFIRNSTPPRATTGPLEHSHCRVLGDCSFSLARYPCTRDCVDSRATPGTNEGLAHRRYRGT